MARLKEVEVTLGTSVEVNKTWYRLTARQVVEIDVTDTKEKRDLVWNQAWNDVTTQIEKQIKSIIE